MTASSTPSSPIGLSFVTTRDERVVISINVLGRRSQTTIENMISMLSAEEPPEHSYRVLIEPNNHQAIVLLPDLFKAIHSNMWLQTVTITIRAGNVDSILLLRSLEGKTNISQLSLAIQNEQDYYGTFLDVLGTLNLTSISMTSFRSYEGLVDILATHSNLKIIKLGSNRVQNAERVAFLDAVMKFIPIIQLTHVVRNEERDVIAERLSSDSVVEMLTLWLRPDADLTSIGHALKTNTTLKSLNIIMARRMNNLVPIFDGLRHNTGLVKLQVSSLDDDDVPHIIRMLQDNTTLEVLGLTFRSGQFPAVSPENMIALSDALKESNLLELSVRGDEEEEEALADAIEAVNYRRYNVLHQGVTLLKLLL